MPLQKQQIPIYFSGGIDTKSPEQLIQPGSFSLLENCVRRKTGRIEKRYGYTALAQDVLNGDDIDSGFLLDQYKDDVILLNEEGLYSYATTPAQWVRRGDLVSAVVETSSLIRNSYRQAMADMAILDTLQVVVYQDSRATAGQEAVRYSVYDTATGASLVSDTLLNANALTPRVVAVANSFLIFYITGGNLVCRSIASGTPTAISSETTVDSATGGLLDATSDGNLALVGYLSGGAANYKLSYVLSSRAAGNGSNGAAAPVTGVSGSNIAALAVALDADNNRAYIAYSNTTVVVAEGYSAALTGAQSATLETVGSVRNLTLSVESATAVNAYYEVGAAASVAAAKNQKVNVATFSYTFTALTVTTAAATFKRSVGLVAKAFYDGTNHYVWTTYESALQSTYFLIRGDGFIAAKVSPGLGGGLTREAESAAPSASALQTGLCSTVANGDDWQTALQIRGQLRAAEDGTVYTTSVGLQSVTVSIDQADFIGDTLGGDYHLAGGVVYMYDGAAPVELGFHSYPEDVTLAEGTAGGSLTPGDVLWYATLYEWTDNQGQVHRSAPSITASFTVTANGKVTVTAPSLRLTGKDGTVRSNCKLVVYRGQTDGDFEVLHRLAEVDNDVTADTVSYTDTGAVSEATLALQEVIYTTGGILENTAPPACSALVNHKNRLFLGGLEDANSIFYSREHVYGEAVNFSDFLSFQVDPRGGGVKAFASLDEKLVIFKQDAIFTLAGDGPVDSGALNDYTNPQMVAGDIGCAYPRSVAIIPAGVIFKSDKGIYLLDRALGVSYIGAAVEDYNDYEVTSAVVLEDVNEVRFTTADGPCLVYNYYFDQWSTFTGYAAASATNGLGTYLRLTSGGVVYQETADTYLDAGATFSMAIETGWLSFDQLQGYQRIYRLYALGDFVTDHYTRIKLGYDFEPGYTETVYFNVDEGLNLSYYGEDATYGSGSPYGSSSSSVYQWELAPRRQKCQSIRLRIDDIDTKVSGGGASFRLVGLSAVVGIKPAGGPKLAQPKDIGSLA